VLSNSRAPLTPVFLFAGRPALIRPARLGLRGALGVPPGLFRMPDPGSLRTHPQGASPELGRGGNDPPYACLPKKSARFSAVAPRAGLPFMFEPQWG